MSSLPRDPDDLGMDNGRNTDPKGQDMSIDTQTLAAKVDRARAALRNAEYDLRRAQDADRAHAAAVADKAAVRAAADSDTFIDPNPGTYGDSVLLPTGEKGRVTDGLPYADGGDWAYIMSKASRTRPTRAFVSSGQLGDEWRIGNTHRARHDQTGANLGDYTVVGIVVYDRNGDVLVTVGDIPTTLLSVCVFK